MLDRAKKTGNGALLDGYDTIRIDGVLGICRCKGKLDHFSN